MTDPDGVTKRENVLIVHWHDLGRNLAAYGASGVRSPNLDRLAAEGILFTDAHAAAPLCSPSRGAIFSGRYPHDNGLIGLAHHGWEYRDDVQTLPALLGEAGWYTALFGMQHESAYPSRLGYHEFDVRNSFCDHVVGRAQNWLRRFTADTVSAHRRILRDAPTVSRAALPTFGPGRFRRAELPARRPSGPG